MSVDTFISADSHVVEPADLWTRGLAARAPYFHNGGQANLHQVVDFYSRGGDRRGRQAEPGRGNAGGRHRSVENLPAP